MSTTDSQVHLWAPETPQRPWVDAMRSYAHGPSFGPAELLAAMDSAGIDRAVLVPPSFEGDRNDLCLAAAKAHPDRFRVMGRISVTSPDSRAALPAWKDQRGMLGIRLTFIGSGEQWLTEGVADWVWPAAEAAGIPIMIFAPSLISELEGVAAKFPGLRVIIDHLGLQNDLVDDEIDPVLNRLVKLARFDNVAVKTSALPNHVSDGYPFRSLRDRISKVLDAFGPERVFWGSDLTQLHCSYSESRAYLEELDLLGAAELACVMDTGIRAWTGWSVESA